MRAYLKRWRSNIYLTLECLKCTVCSRERVRTYLLLIGGARNHLRREFIDENVGNDVSDEYFSEINR